MEIKILSPKEATEAGYLSLTMPYSQSNEQEIQWFKNTLNDLKGCDIVLLEMRGGFEIARHKSEMILPGEIK
jgi:hypothetical protein